MKIKYKVIDTIEVAGGKIYNLNKPLKIRDGKSGAYDIIEYFCKEYLEKQTDKSEVNKKEKLTATIDMETFRKSLVGDGYLKEEVLTMSKKDLQKEFQSRVTNYTRSEAKRSKELGLW